MEIKRRSLATGRLNAMIIDVTQEQLNKWASGALIQDAMPNITPAEREFIMTGITQSEWDVLFSDESEE